MPLGADIPHIGAIGDGQANPDNDQRRGFYPKVLPFVSIGQRREKDFMYRADAVIADQRKMMAPMTMVSNTAAIGVV
ncbi:hypothetical protein N8D56_10710 [Devosia sp. A8/3-2]|nr:hypothetical protein N8D56_10710 [Devosia sp. A8/3-2]